MIKHIISAVVLGALLTSCSTVEGAGVIDAKVVGYQPEHHSGTLQDSNGDLWAVCHMELKHSSKYVILYDEYGDILALVEDGRIVLEDKIYGNVRI